MSKYPTYKTFTSDCSKLDPFHIHSPKTLACIRTIRSRLSEHLVTGGTAYGFGTAPRNTTLTIKK